LLPQPIVALRDQLKLFAESSKRHQIEEQAACRLLYRIEPSPRTQLKNKKIDTRLNRNDFFTWDRRGELASSVSVQVIVI